MKITNNKELVYPDSENEWRELNTKILKSIASLNQKEGWVVDWNNMNQCRFFFAWNHKYNKATECLYSVEQHADNSYYMCDSATESLLEIYTQEEFKFWLTKKNLSFDRWESWRR